MNYYKYSLLNFGKGVVGFTALAGIIGQPTPLRRTEIDPLNKYKLMKRTKELNNSKIGYFWRLLVPTEMSEFTATNRVCRQRFFHFIR